MQGLPLLWALGLQGLSLAGGTETPSIYDNEGEVGSQERGNESTWGPSGQPRSFPGLLSANKTVVIPNSSKALLLGWVITSLVPALYGLVLAVGLPANGVALWVLATRVPRLPSTLLLMNLAAADLLLARWPFGEVACGLATAALYGHMYGSVLLLAAVSLDRYLALVHPLRSRVLRGRPLAAGLCVAAWLTAATLALPLALQQQTFRLADSDRILCHDVLPLDAQASYWRPAFTCLALLGCFLPLLAMALCYGATLRALAAGGQRYGHALRLTALVLASAVGFFAPSNVLLLLHYSNPSPEAWGDLYGAYVPSLALSTLNSCVDPFVYYYVSAEFRDKVRAALCGRPPGGATASKTSGEARTRSSSLL
ncbi:Proteinase-activated receptor 4 [Tupaia chinensis]|uniref:Proteinase-activated receptor 4 n=1 Tax=Tupaia chinensis TaxID=246437 RepID=L9L1C7_TUPCH|nr:Proteinase-activated receptor 4 [Tupaia chinensis]